MGGAFVATALAVGAPLGAQERETERRTDAACRCVDADGKAIDRCVCFVQPDLQGRLMASGVWTGFRSRARLGVGVSTDQGDDRDAQGVRVQDVFDDGPADDAGLEEGDLIVRVNGRSVFDPLEDADDERRLDLDRSIPVQRFLALLSEVDAGDEVEVQYLRDGETRTATVRAEENPSTALFGSWADPGREGASVYRFGPGGEEWTVLRERLRSLGEREGELRRFRELEADAPGSFFYGGPGAAGTVRLRSFAGDPCLTGSGGRVMLFGDGCIDGVELRELGEALGEYFSTDRGVLVVDVREGSTLGLRAGDVVLAVGGREVETPGDVSRILASYETDEDVTLRIVRKGETLEVAGRRR
jgi:hypothetical protein